MKPSKPFVMPPVRIIPPTLEGQKPPKRYRNHRQYFPNHGPDCTSQHYNKGLKTKNNSLFSFVSKIVYN